MDPTWYLIQSCFDSNTKYDLSLKDEFRIGRSPVADVLCASGNVSRNHATIINKDGRVYIRDNNSVNGTFVNNKMIPKMHLVVLNHYDEIGFGVKHTSTLDKELKHLFYRVCQRNKNPNAIELTDSEDDIESKPKSEIDIKDNKLTINLTENIYPVLINEADEEKKNITVKTESVVDTINVPNIDHTNSLPMPQIKKEEIEIKCSVEAQTNMEIETPIVTNLKQEHYSHLKWEPKELCTLIPSGINDENLEIPMETAVTGLNENNISESKEPPVGLAKVESVGEINKNSQIQQSQQNNDTDKDVPVSRLFTSNGNNASETKESPIGAMKVRSVGEINKNLEIQQCQQKNDLDEDFPMSQLFDSANRSTTPERENNDEDNLEFCKIKQELELMDYLDSREIYLSDSGSEDEFSLEELFSSQLGGEPPINKSNNAQLINNIADEAIHNNDVPILAIIDLKNGEQQMLNSPETENTSIWKETTQECASTSTNVIFENPSWTGKKKYEKPPIIEAPKLPNRTRHKLSENNDIDKDESAAKKRKITKEKLIKESSNDVSKKKKKNRKSKHNTYNISNVEKKVIVEARKEKLKKLVRTEQKQTVKGNTGNSNGQFEENVLKRAQTVKVKLSEGRGTFLVNDASASFKPSTSYARHSSLEPVINKSNNDVQRINTTIVNSFTKLPLLPKSIKIPRLSDTGFNKKKSATENILSIVLNWKPLWLEDNSEELITLPLIPPHLKKPEKMVQRFDNFTDYYNLFLPLLLLELWSSISNDYQNRDSDKRKKVMLLKVTDEEKYSKYTLIYCQMYLSKENYNSQMHPRVGDLLIIEMITTAQSFPKIFGYVESIKKSKLNESNTLNESNYSINSRPFSNIFLTVRTYAYPEKIVVGRDMRMRVVAYFASNIRIFTSVINLQYSPLCKLILSPSIEDFVITESARTNLISKEHLNPKQIESILEAAHICCRPKPGIYMIQGPPGTGKSRVIVNLVKQILFTESKSLILLVAPSNGAVDELVGRILSMRQELPRGEHDKIKLVRVGPPHCISKEVVAASLQELAKKHVNYSNKRLESESAKKDFIFRKTKISSLIQQEADLKRVGKNCDEITQKIQKEKRDFESYCKPVIMSNRESYVELRQAEILILGGANIICTTLSSCVTQIMETYFEGNSNKITCCIIDEATQSNEPQTLLPLLLGVKKIVLVGDPQQLSATVMSKHAKLLGLGNSLFSRIMYSLDHLPNNPIKFLNTQYRMHPEICAFPNMNFYNNKLVNGIKHNASIHVIEPYLVFNLHYKLSDSEHINELEVSFVVKLVEEINKQCISLKYSIGVITPYSLQRNCIRQKLNSIVKTCNVDVNTVDGFQGQERDIIILSCVRTTPNNFLSDEKRINVALTRARKALYICASNMLLEQCHVLSQIFRNANERKKLVRVTENHFADEKFLANLIRRQRR